MGSIMNSNQLLSSVDVKKTSKFPSNTYQAGGQAMVSSSAIFYCSLLWANHLQRWLGREVTPDSIGVGASRPGVSPMHGGVGGSHPQRC